MDEIDEAVEAYRSVYRAVQAATAEDWWRLELSMAQLKALIALGREKFPTIGRVAEMLGIGLPGASTLVERLVQQGLAERTEDPQDRRRTYASLTAKGEALVSRLQHGSQERMRTWIAALREEDREALRRGLRALARVASSEAAAAGRTVAQSNGEGRL